jgi:hypothetical protein
LYYSFFKNPVFSRLFGLSPNLHSIAVNDIISASVVERKIKSKKTEFHIKVWEKVISMFTLKKEKKKKKFVDIYCDDLIIYQGKWDDLPLSENIIIEKSIDFFNDPEPCYIHRDAVRVRLLAELEAGLNNNFESIPPQWLDFLTALTGFSRITRVEFSEK